MPTSAKLTRQVVYRWSVARGQLCEFKYNDAGNITKTDSLKPNGNTDSLDTREFEVKLKQGETAYVSAKYITTGKNISIVSMSIYTDTTLYFSAKDTSGKGCEISKIVP